jgi:hypothetical protein
MRIATIGAGSVVSCHIFVASRCWHRRPPNKALQLTAKGRAAVNR